MRDWLSHRADATPEATALLDLDEERQVSFGELDDAVSRTAGRLASLGIGSDDHIGIVLPRRPAAVRILWAVFRLGGVVVPLDPTLDEEALHDRLTTADVTTLVCGKATEEVTAAAAGGVPIASVDEPSHEEVTRLESQQSASIAPVTWIQSDEMTITYTAGTTADSRPVMHRMGNHFASAVDTAFRFGVSPTDRWFVYHPLHHVCGFAPILRSALYGSALVLTRDIDPGSAADAIASNRVTALSVSPPDLERMLDARGTLSDSLRVVVAGGAPASPELLDRCRGYSVPVYHTYLVTEAAGEVAASGPTESANAPGSVGRPLLRTEVTVVDEDGSPVARDEVGELAVSGPTVADGYYDRFGDGSKPGSRVSHGLATGDVGYRDEDGRLWLVSRRADRIAVDGEQIRASDITTVLAELGGVDAAAVVGVPAEEGGEQPAALVVPDDPALDADLLESYCQERLADFVVPVTFVLVDSLPRSPSGAVDRQAVRKRILAEQSGETDDSEERETDDSEGADHRGSGMGSDVTDDRDDDADSRGDDEDSAEATPDSPNATIEEE